MPRLTRYDVECDAFNGRSAPYTASASYYTNAEFTLAECGALDGDVFDKIETQSHVLGEFYRKATATSFGRHLPYTSRIRAVRYETADVTSIKNDPVAWFVEKEDITKTFEVPESVTQIMIYLEDVYMWEGENLLQIEGKLPTTRPRSLVKPIYIDTRPFAEQENGGKKKRR